MLQMPIDIAGLLAIFATLVVCLLNNNSDKAVTENLSQVEGSA